MVERIGFIGSGSQANETESYLGESYAVAFRAVSPEFYDESIAGLISIENADKYKKTKVIATVGTPGLRKKLVEIWQGDQFLTFVSHQAIVPTDTMLGEGTVVAPGVVITNNVKIGKHALINIGATISHDCEIGDFATISPGVHIAGNVKIGRGVFIGIGATVSNNIKIASGSVVGAGAVIIGDINEANSVVVGVPGKTVKHNKDWLSEL